MPEVCNYLTVFGPTIPLSILLYKTDHMAAFAQVMKAELAKFKKVADTIKSHTKSAEAKAKAKGKSKKKTT